MRSSSSRFVTTLASGTFAPGNGRHAAAITHRGDESR
jgi:hypothetical protein